MAESSHTWEDAGPHDGDVVQPPLKIKPPLIALALVAVGVVVHLLVPGRILPTGWVQLAVGLPVVVLGIAVVTVSAKTFARAETDDRFATPTSVIVSEGPYAWSRNPMYVGATTAFVGISLAVNTVWILALVPVLVAYFWFGVVSREERYLRRRFGSTYADYTARVRRWV